MKHDSYIHNRKNIRLKAFDYSTSGSYFVTICTGNYEPFFGIVENGEIHSNDVCRIAMECWQGLPERFHKVSLDEFVFMPNHLHGIINISYNQRVIYHAPTGALIPNHSNMNHDPNGYNDKFVGAQFIAPKKKGVMNAGTMNRTPTLGMVVRSFKALATRKIRLSGKEQFGWQRNYYEHVIRNEDSLKYIREYIINNPLRWELDRENPYRKGEDDFYRWLNNNRLMHDNQGAINHRA